MAWVGCTPLKLIALFLFLSTALLFSSSSLGSIFESRLVNQAVDQNQLLERIFPLHDQVEELPSIQVLKRYTHIVVSGPQRSGTTFVGEALADALGYTHLDEGINISLTQSQTDCNSTDERTTFECKNCYLPLFRSRESVVAQRPTFSHVLHELPDKLGEEVCATPLQTILIIFMARNCLDVFRSQNKIMHQDGGGWTCKFGRESEWRNYRDSPELKDIVDLRDMICNIKQVAWKMFQQPFLKSRGISTLTLGYETLKESWLREAFEQNQVVRDQFGPKDTGGK
jgi:hypothetical protein